MPKNSPIICLLSPFLVMKKRATFRGELSRNMLSKRKSRPFSGFLGGKKTTTKEIVRRNALEHQVDCVQHRVGKLQKDKTPPFFFFFSSCTQLPTDSRNSDTINVKGLRCHFVSYMDIHFQILSLNQGPLLTCLSL